MTDPTIFDLDDDQYPMVSFGADGDLDVNEEQAASLFRKWKQANFDPSDTSLPQTWAEFAKTVQPTFGMNGAVTVEWCGMYLAIETDGYCHSLESYNGLHQPTSPNIMAGALAHSNLGFGLPKIERRILFNPYPTSVESVLEYFFQNRIEGDESYEYCHGETEAWVNSDRASAENLQAHHKDAWKLYINTLIGKRWDHAHKADAGASNQRLLSRVLHEAILEADDERGPLNNDPAVALILHQLAHVMGQPTSLGLVEYREYQDKIAAQLATHAEWLKTIV